MSKNNIKKKKINFIFYKKKFSKNTNELVE